MQRQPSLFQLGVGLFQDRLIEKAERNWPGGQTPDKQSEQDRRRRHKDAERFQSVFDRWPDQIYYRLILAA